MIIFLYGQDSYRSKQKLDEIVGHYKKVHKSGLNLIYLDAQQKDFSDFYSHFKVSSMFTEKKLIVLKNVFLNKKFQEDFLKEIKQIESFKDIVVVYEDQEPDQRLKIFKVLTKECKLQDFKLLDGKNLKLWALKEIENRGAKINMDATDLLIIYTGNNLWQLSNEIKKLSDYKKGAVIKKEDVALLVRPRIEVDIFKTIDALAQKNKQQAFHFIHTHLDNGESPLYLLSMVAYQCKNLLIVKELAEQGLMYASIVKRSGLHPFVVKKNYFQCSKFSLPELKAIYHKIFQTDLAIKTGKVEAETALDLLISQI
ncbi:MAG: DNA polymerase III subunit delta [Candidatus Staskawiczbacteria bacterium RIFCSPLOWO2_01_FULL_40_39]|uniref:DNA polymerase III subunit delta n=1 Tax=Candidatus Staskawiczbacteria bacterium RIFCSPHIGHO2_01_FULL_39_25 TaxID=1802202 RepID=A0A1G2HML9_9BACT|nr:MAG: DNA polymerase III subunit delta [Candidatus Staskawiczbacteria bacterium RIFCSPHIGHO2_01_FULL_39_25]OGZ73204.1 MAG: DNA polymerase III subunit delta [Candidatus Staskawiczbacteria bacterium RIFCSPLOWO2_01_FULL_40_39]